MHQISTTMNKSNGRWTREEHHRFLQGLQAFGKDWKKIEQMIGTRDGAQIRSHAQKYFIKIKKELECGEAEEVCQADTSNSLKQKETVSEEEQHSYFLNKILRISAQQKEFDFWKSLIDHKSYVENHEKEIIECQFKRKRSFLLIEDEYETQKSKKIKI